MGTVLRVQWYGCHLENGFQRAGIQRAVSTLPGQWAGLERVVSDPFGNLYLTQAQKAQLLTKANRFFYLAVDRKGGPVVARYVDDLGVAHEVVVAEDGVVCQSSVWTSDHDSKLTPGS